MPIINIIYTLYINNIIIYTRVQSDFTTLACTFKTFDRLAQEKTWLNLNMIQPGEHEVNFYTKYIIYIMSYAIYIYIYI